MSRRKTEILPKVGDTEKGPVAPLTWVADVPLLTNPVILRAFGLVFVFAYLLIIVIFVAVLAQQGELGRLPTAMIALLVGMAVAAGLMVLVMVVVFRNRMRCRFVLDEDGFGSTVVDRRAQIGASLALAVGAGSGNATLAGAGLAASSGQREYTAWRRVAGVRFQPEARRIVMTAAGWWPVGALHCSEQSYADVAHRVRRIAESRGFDIDG